MSWKEKVFLITFVKSFNSLRFSFININEARIYPDGYIYMSMYILHSILYIKIPKNFHYILFTKSTIIHLDYSDIKSIPVRQ